MLLLGLLHSVGVEFVHVVGGVSRILNIIGKLFLPELIRDLVDVTLL